MSVVIVQALCPERHCVLALASNETEGDKLREILKATLAEAISTGVLNPWCGLCGAKTETWTYEIGQTRFASLAEAAPVLKAAEAGNLMYRRLEDAAGRSYDKPRGAEN